MAACRKTAAYAFEAQPEVQLAVNQKAAGSTPAKGAINSDCIDADLRMLKGERNAFDETRNRKQNDEPDTRILSFQCVD